MSMDLMFQSKDTEWQNGSKKKKKPKICCLQETHLRAKDTHTLKVRGLGFPGGTVVKNPPANAGDMGSSPGQGRSHMPQSN